MTPTCGVQRRRPRAERGGQPSMDILFEIFAGLARKGPGSREETTRALRLCHELPACPRILEIGAGSGVTAVDLARLTAGSVTALELSDIYVEEIRACADQHQLADRISAVQGDMRELDFEDESFDLLWCEGAVYLMGFSEALGKWRRLLTPGGYLAVSEVVWLTQDRPAELVAFWAEEYPGMQTADANRRCILEAGYSAVGEFIIADSCWQQYHAGLERRLDELEPTVARHPEASSVVADLRREIALYRAYPGAFGYAFHVVRKG